MTKRVTGEVVVRNVGLGSRGGEGTIWGGREQVQQDTEDW